jgi:hypothetical protein
MKKFIFLISLTGLLSLNSCSVGYVSEQPNYLEGNRPQRPSESHIWIEGNWYWNNRTHSYYHGGGNWIMPNQGRTYEPGHWRKTRQGYRWVPGIWR